MNTDPLLASLKQLTLQLLAKKPLTKSQAAQLLDALLADKIPPALAGAILALIVAKPIDFQELLGFSLNILDKATKFEHNLPAPILDVVGSGGDHNGTFNVSTATALVLSALGYKVAKHGNRAVTSACGSADVIEALGLNLDCPLPKLKAGLLETNFCFLFAQKFHPSLKLLAPLRKSLPFATIFNFLGPLLNPARPSFLLIGLSNQNLAPEYCKALLALDIKKFLVASSFDGLDEITNTAKTFIYQSFNSEVKNFVFDPKEYGFDLADISQIKGGSAKDNATILENLFLNKASTPITDIVVINAGFAISTLENLDLKTAFSKVKEVLKSGQAFLQLQKIRMFYKN